MALGQGDNVFACPHCAKPGIPVLRRLFLGPAIPATCKACGSKVTVSSAQSLVALLPLLLPLVGGAFLPEFKLVLWAIGGIATVAAFLIYVPLIKAEE